MLSFAFEKSLPFGLSVSRRLKIWTVLMYREYRVDGIWLCTLSGKGICSVIFEPSPVKNVYVFLDYLFAFSKANVEFYQVIFTIIAFLGLTYENSGASWFQIFLLLFHNWFIQWYYILYKNESCLRHNEDYVRLIAYSYFLAC